MIRAIIIDDEINGLKSLELMIGKVITGVKVIASTVDPVKGVDLVNDFRPDIVFLDINMPVLNGFELLKRLEFKAFYLIFTTAYSEYALSALKQSATDYLLKPVDIYDLTDAVEKVKLRLREKEKLPDIASLLAKVYAVNSLKIPVPTKHAVDYVLPNDIVYIEALSNYSQVILADQPAIISYKALKDYELLLCRKNSSFIRIHNSYLINLNFITRYCKDDGGYAVMLNRKSIPVSKHKKEAFLKAINLYPDKSS